MVTYKPPKWLREKMANNTPLTEEDRREMTRILLKSKTKEQLINIILEG